MNEGPISTNVNRLMNSIGFSNELGNVMGAALEARIENNIGVARNLFDAFSSISAASVDNLMAGAFGPAALILRPHNNYNHHFALHHNTHYEREQISTFNLDPFGLQKGVAIDGQKIDIGPQSKGMTPSQFESKLMGDPALRATVEAQLGGRVVYDGNADGRITVARRQPHHCIEYAGNAYQNVATMLARCMNPIAQQNILQSLATAVQQSLPAFDAAAILNNAKLNFDQKFSQLVQQRMRPSLDELLIKLEQILERGEVQAPPPRKKKKKGGIGSKLKKGLKGIKKGVSKFGKIAKSMSKGLLKGTMKILSGGFLKNRFLQKLLTEKLGPLFKIGSGLLGGILGGPVGPAMIAQFAAGKLKPKDLLKAANPLNQMKMFANPKQLVSFGMDQAFGQMTAMFQIANGFSRAMGDVQKQALTQFLRG